MIVAVSNITLFFASGDLDDFLVRYRVAFSQPYIKDLMAKIPTFMILDDHCLTVSIDNCHSQYIDLQLSADNTCLINQSFCFNNTITLKLFDPYDSLAEKCLGEYIITSSDYHKYEDLLTYEFNQQKQKYTISYNLVKNK